MQATDSPSEASQQLQRYYRASGINENSWFQREFSSTKQEPGDSRKFVLRVDRISRALGRLGKTVDNDDKNLVIVKGLSPEYEVEDRIWRVART